MVAWQNQRGNINGNNGNSIDIAAASAA